MTSSFWSNNPCAPSWSSFLKNWWSSSPPKLLEAGTVSKHKIIPIPGCILRRATIHDLTLIPEFLYRYFSFSKSCKCVLPLSYLENSKLEIFIVLEEREQRLIGTVVRRWISNLHVKNVKWQSVALVEYFCVHPAWKKKGVGRWLLSTLHNTAHSLKSPMPPHLILWEGIQPSYPPILAGFYWSKKCISSSPIIQPTPLTQEIWNAGVKGKTMWSEFTEKGNEVSAWKLPAGYVLVSNTFHTSIYGPIGIIISGSNKAIQQLSNTKSQWGILLIPHTNPFYINKELGDGWVLDSPFQWISYNMIVSNLTIGEFPCLCI